MASWFRKRKKKAPEPIALVGLECGVDDAGDDESYVFIEPEDVIASVADFVAACVAAHPNASSVSPETLQKALAETLGELRDGRGGVRRAWDFGVGVVRGASWPWR